MASQPKGRNPRSPRREPDIAEQLKALQELGLPLRREDGMALVVRRGGVDGGQGVHEAKSLHGWGTAQDSRCGGL